MNPRVVLHLTVYLIFWNEASQESVVPTKFLEAFIKAGDRHSTVVIRDWNSGEYEESKTNYDKLFVELLDQHQATILMRSESDRLQRSIVVNYKPLLW